MNDKKNDLITKTNETEDAIKRLEAAEAERQKKDKEREAEQREREQRQQTERANQAVMTEANRIAAARAELIGEAFIDFRNAAFDIRTATPIWDQYAMAALTGLCSDVHGDSMSVPPTVAGMAAAMADAMIAIRRVRRA